MLRSGSVHAYFYSISCVISACLMGLVLFILSVVKVSGEFLCNVLWFELLNWHSYGYRNANCGKLTGKDCIAQYPTVFHLNSDHMLPYFSPMPSFALIGIL